MTNSLLFQIKMVKQQFHSLRRNAACRLRTFWTGLLKRIPGNYKVLSFEIFSSYLRIKLR